MRGRGRGDHRGRRLRAGRHGRDRRARSRSPGHRCAGSTGDASVDEPALVIDLQLDGAGLDVTNRYGTWVVGGDHEH